MKLWCMVILACLLGCAGNGTVTEGDRTTEWQAKGAIEEARRKNQQEDLKQPLDDASKNVGTLQKNHGDPKPENQRAYSPEASAAARKQSDESHSSSPWLATAGLLGLWLVREVGTRWCPFLGPLMDKYAPMLANGSGKNEKTVLAAHEIVEGVKAYVPAEKKEEVKNFIDRVNSRHGVSTHATAIYEKYVKPIAG